MITSPNKLYGAQLHLPFLCLQCILRKKRLTFWEISISLNFTSLTRNDKKCDFWPWKWGSTYTQVNTVFLLSGNSLFSNTCLILSNYWVMCTCTWFHSLLSQRVPGFILHWHPLYGPWQPEKTHRKFSNNFPGHTYVYILNSDMHCFIS